MTGLRFAAEGRHGAGQSGRPGRDAQRAMVTGKANGRCRDCRRRNPKSRPTLVAVRESAYPHAEEIMRMPI